MAEKYVVNGANVGFLTGQQSAIDTMLSRGTGANAKHGFFYLTQDSHRLYVGNEDGSISAVNEGVQTVDNLNVLPNLTTAAEKKAYTGRFFYVQYEDAAHSKVANILCVYNGDRWVQINANTDSTVESNAFDITASNNTATIKQTIENSGGANVDRSFSITGASGVKVEKGTSTTDANGKTVENIKITGDTYTLSSADSTTSGQVEIKLDSANTTSDSKVTLVPGTYTTITNAAGNKITIEGRTVDSLSIEDAANNGNGFTAVITDTQGKTTTPVTYDPVVVYGGSTDDSKRTTTHLVNGKFDLNVYTKAEIDEQNRTLDAMVYQGTIGNTTGAKYSSWSTLDTSKQKNGYTYKLSSEQTINGVTHSVNTLIIMKGTEGADGYIPSSGLSYDIIESTVDDDTTYGLESTTDKPGFLLRASTGGAVGTVKFAGDNHISVTAANSGLDGTDKTDTYTIAHKNVTRSNTTTVPDSPTAATTGTTNGITSLNTVGNIVIPVVTGVTSDAKGHITGVNTVNYSISDTNGSIDELKGSTAVSNNIATIKTTVTATDSAGGSIVAAGKGEASVTIGSSSLTITNNSTSTGINVNMTWGTFS